MSVGGGWSGFALCGDPRQLSQPLDSFDAARSGRGSAEWVPPRRGRSGFEGFGFCERHPRRTGRPAQKEAFFYIHQACSKNEAAGEHFVDVRAPEMYLNDENLPYASMLLVVNYGKYNAMGMTNKVRRTPDGTLACH